MAAAAFAVTSLVTKDLLSGTRTELGKILNGGEDLGVRYYRRQNSLRNSLKQSAKLQNSLLRHANGQHIRSLRRDCRPTCSNR